MDFEVGYVKGAVFQLLELLASVKDGWISMEHWWNDTDRETEVLGEKHYTASVVVEWLRMEHWWNDTDRETEVLGEKHYTASVVDEWMIMERWWNDTDRGNWSTGRKTLYSVGSSWMIENGALVEWYWQGKLKYWEKNIIRRRW